MKETKSINVSRCEVTGENSSSHASVSLSLGMFGENAEGDVANIAGTDLLRIASEKATWAYSDAEGVPFINGLLVMTFSIKRKLMLDLKIGIMYSKAV